jgi:hypothetical protein
VVRLQQVDRVLGRGEGIPPDDDEQVPGPVDLALNDALTDLELQHPQKAQIVKLRFFAGSTLEEQLNSLDSHAQLPSPIGLLPAHARMVVRTDEPRMSRRAKFPSFHWK